MTTAENSQRPQRRPGFGPWATLLILCTWPVLAVGSFTFVLGNHAVTQQSQRVESENKPETLRAQRLYLALLLLGTGGTALLAGALAAMWARHNPSRFSTPATLTAPETPEDLTGLMEQTVPLINKLYQAGNTDHTLETAVTEVRQLVGADRVVIYSLDTNQEGLFIAESVIEGWPKALGATIKDPCFEARYTESYQDGRVRATDDIYEAGLTPCHLEQLEAFEVKANLVAPILNDGILKGLLIAHQCSAPRAWQLTEVQWFAQIAIAIGLALDNAQFRGDLQQTRQQMKALSQEHIAHLKSLQTEVGDSLDTGNRVASTLISDRQQQLEDTTTSIASLEALSRSAADMTTAAEQTVRQHQSMEQALQQLTRSIGPILEGLKGLDPSNLEESEAALKRLNQPADKLLRGLEHSNKLVTQLQRLALKAPIDAARTGQSPTHFGESVQQVTEQLMENMTELRSSAAQIQVVSHHITGRLHRTTTLPVDPQYLQTTTHQLRQLSTACADIGQLIQQIYLAAKEQDSTSTAVSQRLNELARMMNQSAEQTEQLVQVLEQTDTVVSTSLQTQTSEAE